MMIIFSDANMSFLYIPDVCVKFWLIKFLYFGFGAVLLIFFLLQGSFFLITWNYQRKGY